MSRILFDGFDAYQSSSLDQISCRWDTKGSDAFITTLSTRFGTGGAFGAHLPGRYFGKNISATHLFFGGALDMNVITPTVRHVLWAIMDGATFQCCATIDADKILRIRNGGYNGTVLASAAALSGPTNAWYWYEFEIDVDSSAGVARVWREGQQIINATGLDTAGSGAASATEFRLGHADAACTPTTDEQIYWDDFYLLDTAGLAPWNTRLGDSRVYLLKPNAAGDSTQLTPDSGSNYQRVQTVDDDSSYVQSSTVGDKDLYNLDNLPGGLLVSAIFSFAHITRARKDDAGTRLYAQLAKLGTTEAQEADTALLSTYADVCSYHDDNFDTSAALSVSDINALQIGTKVTG
jgi:hypothetical protein